MSGPQVRIWFLYGAIAAALAMGGCTTATDLNAARDLLDNLGSALSNTLSLDYDPPDYDGPPLGDLPIYHLGDAYTYSSGRTETVKAVHDERVVWRNDLESDFVRYRNFVLPAVETRTRNGEIIRTIDAAPDLLWPLVPGTRRLFTSEVRVRLRTEGRERLFRRDWLCTVNGTEQVEVRLGAFDSVKISCDRYTQGTWRQRRTWYYVSEIGHFVRRDDRFTGREAQVVELISIQQAFNGMSSNARRALHELEQKTLERMPSGKAARWTSSDGELAVTMTVIKTMQTEAGQFCRSFRQEFQGNGVDRLVPGLACRTWNGRWVRL